MEVAVAQKELRPPRGDGHHMRGLSVQYLRGQLRDVLGASHVDTVIDVEAKRGAIRAAGANFKCPRDGRAGAAFVDVADDSYAGQTNLMLSYTWQYTVESIVEALIENCNVSELDACEVRVWICCLCINQHRVKEAGLVSADCFLEAFSSRVKQIGKVLALISPWSKPLYFQRVWTLFETWTATYTKDVQLVFFLPATDRRDFLEELAKSGTGQVWRAIARVNVEVASASVDADKEHIMSLIVSQGGVEAFNMQLKQRLHAWFLGVSQLVAKQHFDRINLGDEALQQLDLGLVSPVASILVHSQDLDRAIGLLHEAIRRVAVLGAQELEADFLCTLGNCHYSRAMATKRTSLQMHDSDQSRDLQEAIRVFAAARRMFVTCSMDETLQYARLLRSLGGARRELHLFDEALLAFNEAQRLHTRLRIVDTEDRALYAGLLVCTARCYHHPGLAQQGRQPSGGKAHELYRAARDIYGEETIDPFYLNLLEDWKARLIASRLKGS